VVLPLDYWLEIILTIVNQGEPRAVSERLRSLLEQLIKDKNKLPLRHQFAWSLPPLLISVTRGNRLRLQANLDPSSQAELEDPDWFSWMATKHRHEFEGVIYALSADPLGERIRRCDHCRVFFVARRNHSRPHHFCSEQHRRAFDHAHRDPKQQAEYMRQYRQNLQVRRRAGRGRRRKSTAP
jgi:hypothetical protein